MTYTILVQDGFRKVPRPFARAKDVGEAVWLLIHHRGLCKYDTRPGTPSYQQIKRDADRAANSAQTSYEATGRAIGLSLENGGTDEPVMTLEGGVKFFMFLEP